MDDSLLLWINQGWAHPWLDALFGWVSQRAAFSFPLLLLILALFVQRWKMAGIKLWLILVGAILLGDLLGNVVKHSIEQYRPCVTLADTVRLVESPFAIGCSTKPHGMPSNHALDFFLAAAFVGTVLRSWRWGLSLGTTAVVVGLSRIYLGVHYPSQVLAGALLGVGLGLLAAGLTLRYAAFASRLQHHPAAS